MDMARLYNSIVPILRKSPPYDDFRSLSTQSGGSRR
jgi:hypothetical protein